VVIGAGLAMYAGTRDWWTEETTRPVPLPPIRNVISGRTAMPWIPASALVVLAGAAALFATKRVGRAIVAGLIVLAGIGLIVAGISGLYPPANAVKQQAGWPLLVAVAGLVVSAGGIIVVIRHRVWQRSTTLGNRFDAPMATAQLSQTKSRQQDSAVLWDTLDSGTDPTTPGDDLDNHAR
jgi:hypothetical protein